jgi:hypothetical protein
MDPVTLTENEKQALEERIRALASDLVANGVMVAEARPMAGRLVLAGWRK